MRRSGDSRASAPRIDAIQAGVEGDEDQVVGDREPEVREEELLDVAAAEYTIERECGDRQGHEVAAQVQRTRSVAPAEID